MDSPLTLKGLIEKSYSKQEADRHATFVLSDRQKDAVTAKGKDIIKHIPPVPGACVAMSAMWTAIIRDNLNLPAYCVAGDFVIDGHKVWASGTANETACAFPGINLDWNGHSWVFIGGYVGDASVFRTAYSPKSPPVLARLIREKFGPGRGLMMADALGLSEVGLVYIPKHVLTETQMNGVLSGFKEHVLRRLND